MSRFPNPEGTDKKTQCTERMGCCSKFPLRVLGALTSAAPGDPGTLRLPSGTFRWSLSGLLLQGVLAHFKQEPLFHPALKDLWEQRQVIRVRGQHRTLPDFTLTTNLEAQTDPTSGVQLQPGCLLKTHGVFVDFKGPLQPREQLP